MTDEALSKLRSEIMPAVWRDLRDHAERDALFMVAVELDLAEVALRVVNDDVPSITSWLSSDKLVRPTEDQKKAWSTLEGARTFNFIIVQPYVLVQEIGH